MIFDKCLLFGCQQDENHWCCCRCGADPYDSDFVEAGSLHGLVGFWRWLRSRPRVIRRRIQHRCDVCRKRMWLSSEHCCSDKCYSQWIPF